MIQAIQTNPNSTLIDSRMVEAKEAVAIPTQRKANSSPLSTLFPIGDELSIGDGSKVVREAMQRVKQGLPAGGFSGVPEEISSIPKRLGPIMHHIVALMDGSDGDRLREIAKDAQEALRDLAGGGIVRDKAEERAALTNSPVDDSPSAIQRSMRAMRLVEDSADDTAVEAEGEDQSASDDERRSMSA